MKKIISTAIIATTLHLSGFAQETTEKASEIKKPSSDFLMIQLHHDGWNQTGEETANTGGLGRGISAYLMYDFKLGKKETTHFSFAAGVGFSANNIYFKDQLPNLKTTDRILTFMNTPEDQKSHKYNTTFIEAPLELRYFGNANNRNKGLKVAIGTKVGLLMGSHTKYSEPISGTYVVQKVSAKKFNQTWKMAPYVRVGWGNFSVFAQYNITSLYKVNEGPEIFPYSIGLTISGL